MYCMYHIQPQHAFTLEYSVGRRERYFRYSEGLHNLVSNIE